MKTKRKRLNKFDTGGLKIPGGKMEAIGLSTADTVNLSSVQPEQIKVEGLSINGTSGVNIGGLANAFSGLTSAISTGVSNAKIADTSELESTIDNVGNTNTNASSTDDILNAWSNMQHLDHVSWRDVRGNNAGGASTSALGSAATGALSGAMFGPIGAGVGAAVGAISSGIGSLVGRIKANKKAKELNKKIDKANAQAESNLINAAENVNTQNALTLLANSAAYGGPINMNYTGTMSPFGNRFDDGGVIDFSIWRNNLPDNLKNTNPNLYNLKGAYDAGLIPEWNSKDKSYHLPTRNPNTGEILKKPAHPTFLIGLMEDARLGYYPYMKDGKIYTDTWKANKKADGGSIHIKPSKRGTFTAAAKKHGKSVQAFASQVLANKDNYSPAMVKKANFARNASKWHSYGGELTHGGIFSNGVTTIDNGGTHEENPYEGVQMGIDNQGIPNLVEEGEVVWNDYVFSNRLSPTKEMRKQNRYRGKTFADVAKNLQKESEERPNDPISKRGLDASMSRLALLQEGIRGEENKGNKFELGGHKNSFKSPGIFDWDSMDLSNTVWDNSYQGILPSITQPQTNNVLSNKTDNNDNKKKKNNKDKTETNYATWLRYAPALGSAIGLGMSAAKPDYTSANTILEAANQAGNFTPISYTPVGNYLAYNPFDRNYYINKLNAQSSAARRALINQSNGNRATAMAGILAADYNAQEQLGNLARQAEEYNLAQRQKVEEFNRGTNMANSEMGLKADMANQEMRLKANASRLSGVAQAMSMREAIDSNRNNGIAGNLTNLFDSLGNIGVDAYNRADRDMLINSGIFGTLSTKPQEWSDKRWNDYKKAVSGVGYSKGGKLKKRRGGLTY